MARSLSKAQRLKIVLERLQDAPPATDAAAAMAIMNRILNEVEDEFSGVPKDPNPPRAVTLRMYPPRIDSIVVGSDGSMVATSARHTTLYGADGSVRVTRIVTGQVVFQKRGGV